MQIGMMNDPGLDAAREVRWASRQGFEFMDLTVEGPAADVEHLNIPALQAALADTGLGIVGHTAWYLPFGSPVKELRTGAIAAVSAIFEPAAALGIKLLNVHVDRGINSFAYDDTLRWNAESFARLAEAAEPYGLTIMIENVVNNFNNAKAFRTLLAAHPALRLHLDMAHASVKGDKSEDFLKAHADKLVHVHISDNKRTHDDHLPLGVGTINWPEQLGLLKGSGYDGTITLEVFTDDRSYVVDSAARLRRMWDAAQGPTTDAEQEG